METPVKPTNDRSPRKTAVPPLSRKRFRIEKLEERIAPKKGGNGTQHCGSGGSSNFASDTGGSGGSNY